MTGTRAYTRCSGTQEWVDGVDVSQGSRDGQLVASETPDNDASHSMSINDWVDYEKTLEEYYNAVDPN
jgi:hypothetical protein